MDCSKENDVIKLSVVHLPSQPDLSAIACTSIISLLLKSKPATTKNQHCNDVFFWDQRPTSRTRFQVIKVVLQQQ